MSLKNIIEKIKLDGRQKAEAIIQKAREEAQKIQSAGEKKTQKKSEQIIEEATRSAQQKDKRMILAAELAGRKEILAEKQKTIAGCFQAAIEQIVKMPDQKYLNIIKNMLLASASSDFLEVIFSSKDRKRVHQGFIDEVNSDLTKKGRNNLLRLSREIRDIRGGFILKGDRVEMDNSFPSILKYQQSDLETDVAKILFE